MTATRRTPLTADVAIPAATLILFRAVADGPPELLMIERAAGMTFAPGALVFPGGRVDPHDHEMAHGDAETAARIAAIRETIEEAGVAVALSPPPDAATTARIRAGLSEGFPFGDLLREAGCTIVPQQLVAFARWRPDLPEARVFDTRFFLAEAPPGAAATSDGTESMHVLWASASAVLDAADAGRHRIIFPTRRNLERLATFGDYRAARAAAGKIAIRCITPWVERRGDGDWLCIPEDQGYPVTREPLATARRG